MRYRDDNGPAFRLLEMLDAWTQSLEADEVEGVRGTLPAVDVAALYVEACDTLMVIADPTQEPEAVRVFVTERLLPMLTTRSKADAEIEERR